ncbi:histidine kinase [Xanthobacter sp. TB0139]|uniref:histidine kinase n=1 Tax=Xanthobacter sp. TB0139 TaxID=3459178 RepID=UPI0040391116
MPTLMRLLSVLAILAALGLGTVWLLATQVEPQPREISFSVPIHLEQVPAQKAEPQAAAKPEEAGR